MIVTHATINITIMQQSIRLAAWDERVWFSTSRQTSPAACLYDAHKSMRSGFAYAPDLANYEWSTGPARDCPTWCTIWHLWAGLWSRTLFCDSDSDSDLKTRHSDSDSDTDSDSVALNKLAHKCSLFWTVNASLCTSKYKMHLLNKTNDVDCAET